MLTTVAVGRVYHFSHVVGRQTPRGVGFQSPSALAIGHDGVVYIVSRGLENTWGTRVGKLFIGAPDEEEFLCDVGNYGDRDGQLTWPTSVALDKDGNVYVADEWLQRISIFDKDGNFLDKWGKAGAGDGELDRPSGMAFDSEDNLFIVESGNNRVQKFTKEGIFLAKFGEEGSAEGQFNLPWGMTIDKSDDIYVADWKNHRVQKFSPEGTFLASFGTFGTHVGKLNHPSDVAVDGEGDVYVCDWKNHRVQIFAPDGEVITSLIGDAQDIGKWGRQFVEANVDMMKARRRVKSLEPEWRFYYPTGVAFDEVGSRIIIVDCQRNRVQIYLKDNGYVDPQFNL